MEIISHLWSLDFFFVRGFFNSIIFGGLIYFGLIMFMDLYKFSRLVMHLNSFSMDLGHDNRG